MQTARIGMAQDDKVTDEVAHAKLTKPGRSMSRLGKGPDHDTRRARADDCRRDNKVLKLCTPDLSFVNDLYLSRHKTLIFGSRDPDGARRTGDGAKRTKQRDGDAAVWRSVHYTFRPAHVP